MKVYCDNCGAGYNINPDTIPGNRAKARCKKCNGIIIISKPTNEEVLLDHVFQEPAREQADAGALGVTSTTGVTTATLREEGEDRVEGQGEEVTVPSDTPESMPVKAKDSAATDTKADAETEEDVDDSTKGKGKKERKRKERKPREKRAMKVKQLRIPRIKISLMTQATFTFLVLLLMGGTLLGTMFYFADQTMTRLNAKTLDQARLVISSLAEEGLSAQARLAAREVAALLARDPDMDKGEYNQDEEFKAAAVRTFSGGYTFLFEGPDEEGIRRIWAHPDEEIVYSDLAVLKEGQGAGFQGFWRAAVDAENQQATFGTYQWKGKNRGMEEKMIACVAVPDSNYIIAAVGEAGTGPLADVAQEVRTETLEIGRDAILFALSGCLAMLFFGFLFVRGMVNRLRVLLQCADRISTGDIEHPVFVGSVFYDEITGLAEVFKRMQTSLSLAMVRLSGKDKE